MDDVQALTRRRDAVLNTYMHVQALTRRRDAVLNTYMHCGYAPTRAMLVLVSLASEGRWTAEERIWRHARYVEYVTSGVEAIELEDWKAIEDEGWSSTELILIRSAADIGDFGHVLTAKASVGDLVRLNDGQFAAVSSALGEAQAVRGADPAVRTMLAESFDRTIDVFARREAQAVRA